MRATLLVLLFSSPLALNADVINAGIIGLTGGGSFEWNSFIPGSLISFTASGTNGLHTLSMNISVDPVAYFPSFVGLPGVLVGPDELVPTGPAAGACYWTGTVTIDSYSNTSGGTQCVTADWSIGGGVGTVDIYQLVFTGGGGTFFGLDQQLIATATVYSNIVYGPETDTYTNGFAFDRKASFALVTPEPAVGVLVGFGLTLLFAFHRRRGEV